MPKKKLTKQEAGRLGGVKTAKRGAAYFKRIGKLGGLKHKENDPDSFRHIGRLGGLKTHENAKKKLVLDK